MNALLVRVAADLTAVGGSWNGPVDSRSRKFVYVPIPEASRLHAGLEKRYTALIPALADLAVELPGHLRSRRMHLDPDFSHLTYRDVGQRAKQLHERLGRGDLVVFYAGLRDVNGARELVYAIIGLLVVEEFVLARDVPARNRDMNAHARRVLAPGVEDLIVVGQPGVSGRLERCLPIGERRDRAYRVRRNLLDEWGGLSVNDGYVQRSARLPRFLDAPRFIGWLERQRPTLKQANN
ncbi:MAG: hypothetical protein WEE64_03290 [Dehalococcoidia bacterium]